MRVCICGLCVAYIYMVGRCILGVNLRLCSSNCGGVKKKRTLLTVRTTSIDSRWKVSGLFRGKLKLCRELKNLCNCVLCCFGSVSFMMEG